MLSGLQFFPSDLLQDFTNPCSGESLTAPFPYISPLSQTSLWAFSVPALSTCVTEVVCPLDVNLAHYIRTVYILFLSCSLLGLLKLPSAYIFHLNLFHPTFAVFSLYMYLPWVFPPCIVFYSGLFCGFFFSFHLRPLFVFHSNLFANFKQAPLCVLISPPSMPPSLSIPVLLSTILFDKKSPQLP